MPSAILLALAMAIAAACGSAPPSVRTTTPRGDWLPRAAQDTSGVFMDARLSGVLIRDSNCLYIEAASQPRFLLSFPANPALASFDETTDRLTLLGHSLKVSEAVVIGGGQVPASPGFWSRPPAPSCDTDRVWQVGEPVSP